MTYLLLWFGVFALLALWSVAAWALHGLGAWVVSSAGTLGFPAAGIEPLMLPAWVAAWLPADLVQALAGLSSTLRPWFDTVLVQAPALAGGLSLAVWVLWALGAGLLILLGLGASAALTMWRRRVGRARTGAAVPAIAG